MPTGAPTRGYSATTSACASPSLATRAAIRVDREVRGWTEGGSLIFDDTYEHEAWNDTDGVRVVLFVDFVRPLRFPANAVNWLVLQAIAFSPFIGDAKRRHNDWEQRFENLKARREPAAVG